MLHMSKMVSRTLEFLLRSAVPQCLSPPSVQVERRRVSNALCSHRTSDTVRDHSDYITGMLVLCMRSSLFVRACRHFAPLT